MGDTTPLSLPADLPYPITITRLCAAAGDQVHRGDKLLEYSFTSATRRKEISDAERNGKPLSDKDTKDDMVGSWESPIDGQVVSWMTGVQVRAKIEQRRGTKTMVRIEQPCTHPQQYNGLCAVCGEDIVRDDYLSRPAETEAGPSRYPGSFELAHDAYGVTVSTDEAKRLETMTRDNLLANRKLSLIVDLDQTIIHTTVDPTVGKWMDECEEDAKQQEQSSKEQGDKKEKDASEDSAETTTPPGSPPASATKPQRDRNPNAEALKDVAKFELPDDLPPGAKHRGPPPMRSYYTKPRPGLKKFLEEQSKLYEMHVYTMGTRTYADAICKIVDPDGSIFQGRILSRDESGSMKTKNLMRLFPTDQSMVVIIDDRSDVWGNSPNLVKVVPYDFFIGIGDINGAFLPPTQPAVSSIPGAPKSPSSNSISSAASSPMPETPTDIPSQEDGLLRQSKILDEMANSRPLEQLEHEHSECDDSGSEGTVVSDRTVQPQAKEDESSKSTEDHAQHKHHRKALLNPIDDELDRVGNILTQIHSEYYTAYDRRDPSSSQMPLSCDTPLIIQEIKDQVLSGCVVTFTGVIARGTDPAESDIWRSTEEFGGTCVHDLSDRVTHLVTASIGTEKMYRATKMPGIKTVWLAWLQSSIALWKRAPELPFLAQPEGQSAAAAPSQPESPKPSAAAAEEDHTAWDDEFDKWLEEGSDSEGGSEAGGNHDKGSGQNISGGEGDKESSAGEKDDDDVMSANGSSGDDDEEYHRWSRASTPARSILASAAGSRAPSPGPPRHVRYADEENLPLERVREPRPGEIVSFPPRKKRKLLMLGAPSDDDDVPEANKMVYHAPGFSNGEASSKQADADESDGSETATEGEDEFAKMLAAELADNA